MQEKILSVCIPFFTACNLHCDFCFEKGSKKTQPRKEDFSLCMNAIRQQIFPIAKEKYDTLSFKFDGGEIFADFQPDWLYRSYEMLVRRIVMESPVFCIFKFISNGVFSNVSRAKSLLDSTHAGIEISYDLCGRYKNPQEKILAEENIRSFHQEEYLDGVSFVETRQNLQSIICLDEKDLDQWTGISISATDYMPESGWRKNMPSSEDLYNFLIWGIKNRRYQIDKIRNVLQAAANPKCVNRLCQCGDAVHYDVTEQCFYSDCLHYQENQQMFYGNKKVTPKNNFYLKTQLMYQKDGCMACEYFLNCPQHCPQQVIFKPFKPTFCHTKKVLTEITAEDIKNYLKWRRDYDRKNAERVAKCQRLSLHR